MSNNHAAYITKTRTNHASLLQVALFVFSFLSSLSLTAQDATTKSHISSDKIFILNYPTDWKINNMVTGYELFLNAPGVGSLGNCNIRVNINRKTEGYENADIHELSEVELKLIKAQQLNNVEILSSTFSKMNDHEWWLLKYKVTQGKKTFFADHYETIHNNKVYVFQYFSVEKNYEKHKEAANKIITGVEFLTKNTQAPAKTSK